MPKAKMKDFYGDIAVRNCGTRYFATLRDAPGTLRGLEDWTPLPLLLLRVLMQMLTVAAGQTARKAVLVRTCGSRGLLSWPSLLGQCLLLMLDRYCLHDSVRCSHGGSTHEGARDTLCNKHVLLWKDVHEYVEIEREHARSPCRCDSR